MLQNQGQWRARRHQFGRQIVHFAETVIRDHKPLVRIEQAQALRHVAQCGVEPIVDDLELGGLLGQQTFAALLGRHVFMGRHPAAFRSRRPLDRYLPAIGWNEILLP